MCQVNILQAKTELSKLILLLEKGIESEVIIARNGNPVARMELYSPKKIKVGVAKGKFNWSQQSQDDFDNMDAEIAGEFGA